MRRMPKNKKRFILDIVRADFPQPRGKQLERAMLTGMLMQKTVPELKEEWKSIYRRADQDDW